MFTAAIIQDSPVFLDLRASVEKASGLIREAAARGATLIAFPETWLPGYPLWLDWAPKAALWDYGPAKELYSTLVNNSVTLDGPEMAALAEAAGEATIVMGAHERLGGTLYNSMIYIRSEGVAGVHRKLTPTYTERLVWGQGDGSTLTVVNGAEGSTGGLICWEHWMPLVRAAMHARHELVHVAQWPMVKEMMMIASRQYAFEGQCYVLACGATLTRAEMLAGPGGSNELLQSITEDLLMRGGSAIIAPDGSFVAGPTEGPVILAGEIDPRRATEGRLFLDTDGHYSRPDIFRLEVDERPRANVVFKK
jgi:predicted amidohydrolase